MLSLLLQHRKFLFEFNSMLCIIDAAINTGIERKISAIGANKFTAIRNFLSIVIFHWLIK